MSWPQLPWRLLVFDGSMTSVGRGIAFAALMLLVLVVLLDWIETGLPRARWARPPGLALLMGPVVALLALQVYASVASGRPWRILGVIMALHVVWLGLSRLPRLVRTDVEEMPVELVAVSMPVNALVAVISWLL